MRTALKILSILADVGNVLVLVISALGALATASTGNWEVFAMWGVAVFLTVNFELNKRLQRLVELGEKPRRPAATRII